MGTDREGAGRESVLQRMRRRLVRSHRRSGSYRASSLAVIFLVVLAFIGSVATVSSTPQLATAGDKVTSQYYDF